MKDKLQEIVERGYGTLNRTEVEQLLAIAMGVLGVTSVSLEVDVSLDYSSCYYEGDTPSVSVDGFTIGVRCDGSI